MSEVHALLIGVETYSAGTSVPKLRGCVNDVRAVEGMLKGRLGERLASCTVLTNEAATRAAVQDALATLASIVAVGDVAWIHYSGHGSKARINDPAATSGFLETLVLWESRTEGGRDLYDREFGRALAAIEARGAEVICLLDCCHAGGATRDADAATVRACAPDLRDAPVPTEGDAVANPLAAPPELERAVVLAACRDEEKAAELLPDGVDTLWHGAATWFLLRALQNPNPNLTWGRIHEEMSAAIRTRYARQTPQLLGRGETLLFGGVGAVAAPSLLVLQVMGEVGSQRIQVDGGAALGINVGTRLEIFSASVGQYVGASVGQYVGASAREVLATALVERVEVGTAWAVVEGASGGVPSIPVAARARVVAYGYGSARLKVAVDVAELVEGLAGASPLFEVVESVDAEAIVRGGENRAKSPYLQVGEEPLAADRIWIEDAAGTVRWRPLASPAEGDARTLIQALEHLAVFRNVQRLTNLAIGAALEGALELSTPVALKPSRSERAAFGQATALVRDAGGIWQAVRGQEVGVQVTNRHDARLLVTVLALNPDGSITQVEPRFERQTTLAPGRSMLVRFKTPEPDVEDRMMLKMLATVEPVSFASLLLPPRNDGKPLRRDAPVRDAGALGWLLDALRRTGGTPTRPAFTDPDDQWIALDIPFQITSQVSPSSGSKVE